MKGSPRRAATAALFMDRDGVLNVKAAEGRYIEDAAAFRFLPGAIGALVRIRTVAPRLALIVVTNQRGIATGALTEAALTEVHAAMTAELRQHSVSLDGVYVCRHERDSCDCRKPRTGLLLQALRDFPGVRFSASRLVGDALADLQAAAGVGMPAYLVGDARSRGSTLVAAKEQGVPVAGEADGLRDLVQGEAMRDWLAGLGTTGAAPTEVAVH